MSKHIKCTICKKPVPVTEDGEVYASNIQLPFLISVTGNMIHRIIIKFPKQYPLCSKCRQNMVVRSLQAK